MSNINTYELAFLALASLSEKEVASVQSTLADAVTQAGGQVVSTGDVHFIRLAYEMTKKVGSKHVRHNDAYFSWLKLSLDPLAVNALEQQVRAHDDILRHMIISTATDDSLTNVFTLEQDTDEEESTETEAENQEESTDTDSSEDTDNKATDDPSTATQDDLTRIEGIGPVIATTLVNGGIASYAQLADAVVDAVATMIEGVRGSHDPSTWAQQAGLARDEKWDELDALQDELKGGRA